jgi:hypothetical protein
MTYGDATTSSSRSSPPGNRAMATGIEHGRSPSPVPWRPARSPAATRTCSDPATTSRSHTPTARTPRACARPRRASIRRGSSPPRPSRPVPDRPPYATAETRTWRVRRRGRPRSWPGPSPPRRAGPG